MKEITTIKQLQQVITHYENDCEYISFVYTPWHLFSFEAFLRLLQTKTKNKLRGIVFVQKHKLTGYALSKDDFSGINCKSYYYDVNSSFGSKRSVLDRVSLLCKKNRDSIVKRKLYVFSSGAPYVGMMTMLYRQFPDRQIISCVYDEGLSVYLQDKGTWFNTCVKESKGVKNKIRIFAQEYMINPLSIKLLKRNGKLKEEYLLAPKGKEWVPNNRILPHYKNVFEESVIGMESINVGKKPYILINTQVLDERDNADTIMNVFKSCIDVFCGAGINVVIKPHPREDSAVYRNLGVEIIEYNEASQERMLYLVENKPVAILGVYSTTLVSCRLINGIRTISIAPILEKEKCYNPETEQFVERFIKTFSGMVTMVENYDELLYVVQKMV